MTERQFKLLFLLLGLVLSGCSDDDEFTTSTIDSVVELSDLHLIDPYSSLESHMYTITKNNITKIAGSSTIRRIAQTSKYDVSAHKLTYTTALKGKEILVSGVLMIPLRTPSPAPLLSFHHGTIMAEVHTPSNSTSDNLGHFGIFSSIALTTNGYITFTPDYIGYGESVETLHPYLLYQPAVETVQGLIDTGIDFLKLNDISYQDGRIFLAGYSQGGYVTCAINKEIHRNGDYDLEVAASAIGGGTYDLHNSFKTIMSRMTNRTPNLVALGITSYNTYLWNRPLTDFFAEPYASKMNWIFNGELDHDEVNRELHSSTSMFFNPAFVEAVQNGGESTLENDLKSNSVFDWTPKSPTRIWHGEEDQVVFPENATLLYDAFIANGANPVQIELVLVPGVGHAGSLWLENTIEWFSQF